MNSFRTKRTLIGISLVLLAGLVLAACQTASSGTAAPSGNGYYTAPTDVGSSGSKTTTGAEIKTSTMEGLGTFLVDAKGMTLYLYTKDSPGVSVCKDACLEAWPPLLTNGDPVAGEGVTGKLGTITRDDGSVQVTYNDMPLYYYITDTKAGDTTGQGVGGVWYVIEP